ncbi:MAG TPA: DUF1611 domain-containing protein [Elusimicrobiota bacterium]|nr:DUF1611 domain-containing protein [Elusimicrobiota bacterium]
MKSSGVWKRGGILVLADRCFSADECKTGVGAIRYMDNVVGVLDREQAGKTTRQVLGFGKGLPIVARLSEAMALGPDHVLLGISPFGGRFPSDWRPFIRESLRRGLNIISGLHDNLSDDREWRALAHKNHCRLIDLRKPPEGLTMSRGSWLKRKAVTILTVGSHSNVGKMTTALELRRAFLRRGFRAGFVATGQTGILIKGGGVCIDAVPGDFMAGAVESMIDREARRNDCVFVEGQGSLTNQAFSGVTAALLHGTMPDAMVFCHKILKASDRFGFRFPPLADLIRSHEDFLAHHKRCRVVAVALNTDGLSDREARKTIARTERSTGLPADDIIRNGPGRLSAALLKMCRR